MSLRRLATGIRTRTRVLTQGVAYLASRTVYGNFAGLRNNLKPRRELAGFRAITATGSSEIVRADQRAAADHLHERGFVLKGGHIHSPELLRTVVERYRACIEEKGRSVGSPNGATRFVLRPLEAIPEIPHLLSADIQGIIRTYYGCSLRVKSVRAWRNYHVAGVDAGRDVYSNTFHNDGMPATGLRVFTLLCDGVTRDTGAFRFHDKAASRAIVRMPGYFHRYVMTDAVRRKLIDPATLRYFEGDIGDTCICNTQECLHAASVPKAGTFRDIVQFEIEPAPSRPTENADPFRGMAADIEIEDMQRYG